MSRPYSLAGLRPGPDPDRRTTFSRLLDVCARYPERTALVYLGERVRFARLAAWIEACAGALHELGVRRGDRVLLYLGNTPQWVVASFAVQRLGAVVVPVSPIYTAHELEAIANDAGARVVVCQDTNFGYVHALLPRTPLEQVVVTGLADLLPAWKRGLGRLLDRVPTGRVARGAHVHRLRRLLRAKTAPPDVAIDPWRDLATLLYTGGTTARPKGVPGNHATEVAYLDALERSVLAGHVDPSGDRVLLASPLYHIMARGFFIGAGLHQGAATVLLPLPHVDATLAAIERHRVRWMLGVPALYRMALDCERIDDYRLDSLRFCLSGGDVLPAEVFRRWRERTGVAIRQVYGATEVGHVAYGRLDREPEPGAIGPPLPGYDCRVVDPDTLEPVPAGEVGELVVGAAFTINSYWRRDEETRRAYVRIDDELFYRMGDLVRIDARGELHFVERTADVIKHKGYRVSASEVEAVLVDHPTVVAACVVGLPDARVGERIKAIVVPKHDVRGASATELRRFCRERLSPWKVPHVVELRDALPRSKVGKLLRRQVRDEELRRRGRDGGAREPF